MRLAANRWRKTDSDLTNAVYPPLAGAMEKANHGPSGPKRHSA